MKITTGTEAPEKVINKELTYDSFTDGKVFPGKITGKLPPMGWNSWNAFGSGNTEALTKIMADRMIELGLDKLGYEYVVLDDGCYNATRVNDRLAPDKDKFPSGFKALADYIHAKGLKFGMYNDIGTRLCSGLEVGTCGHESVDAANYKDWDIDYLKVDNCYYLWDDATFSDETNIRYVCAPKIKSVTFTGGGPAETKSFDASEQAGFTKKFDAVKNGRIEGVRENLTPQTNQIISSKKYICGIGTNDGTGPANSPRGSQSAELLFDVEVPADGTYRVYVEYSTDMVRGAGEWLTVSVGEKRFFDALLPKTGRDEFVISEPIEIELKKGTNTVRFMNHRRQENVLNAYAAMLSALLTEIPDREVLLSICEWGKTNPGDWGYKVGNCWRILNDITFAVGSDGDPGSAKWEGDYTDSILSQYNKAVIMDEFAGLERGWNDPDMLVIGMNGMTDVMNKSHMSMWCMLNAPLMLGLDLRRIEKNDAIYKVISNEKIIALNQDALGIQAKRIATTFDGLRPDTTYITNNERVDILAKPLADGSVALGFFNLSSEDLNDPYFANTSDILEYLEDKMVSPEIFDTAKSFTVENLWTGEKYQDTSGVFESDNIKARDCMILRITPNPGR